MMKYNHKQPCDCINCNSIRRKAFKGYGLYCVKSKRCFTWKLNEYLVCRNLDFDTFIYVFRELTNKDTGSHLDAVVGVILNDSSNWIDGPTICVEKSSLEPVD